MWVCMGAETFSAFVKTGWVRTRMLCSQRPEHCNPAVAGCVVACHVASSRHTGLVRGATSITMV
jgi:hypothetical protein